MTSHELKIAIAQAFHPLNLHASFEQLVVAIGTTMESRDAHEWLAQLSTARKHEEYPHYFPNAVEAALLHRFVTDETGFGITAALTPQLAADLPKVSYVWVNPNPVIAQGARSMAREEECASFTTLEGGDNAASKQHARAAQALYLYAEIAEGRKGDRLFRRFCGYREGTPQQSARALAQMMVELARTN